MVNVVAVIPARGGSRSIPRKNIKTLNGHPLLAYSIAAGLEAIAVGFGLRFPNDEENLALQFEMYDALYAWCRLQVAGE